MSHTIYLDAEGASNSNHNSVLSVIHHHIKRWNKDLAGARDQNIKMSTFSPSKTTTFIYRKHFVRLITIIYTPGNKQTVLSFIKKIIYTLHDQLR